MSNHYADMLYNLLPRGIAWARARGSNLGLLLEGIAQEFERVEDDAERLINECIPDTTGEMLTDWERVAGLPECCLRNIEQTESQRKSNLIAKLAQVGGASLAYFIEIAGRQGFDITIDESPSFIPYYFVEGVEVDTDNWQYVWEVNSATTPVFYFEAGTSGAYDRLSDFGVDALECYINNIKPAHTHVLFTYDTAYLPGFDSGFDSGFGS